MQAIETSSIFMSSSRRYSLPFFLKLISGPSEELNRKIATKTCQ